MRELTLRTVHRCELIDITAQVAATIREEKMADGLCHVYVPHTTAALTVNENADPAVCADILNMVAELVPQRGSYRHGEGNSDAHIKASLFGTSQILPVRGGTLALGTWQSIFFCEFDGPRTRMVYVTLLPTA